MIKSIILSVISLVLVFFSTLAVAQNIVRDEETNTIFDRSACHRLETNGVIETLLELGMGKFKAAQAACCAATVEKACGEEFESMPSDPRETKYANCIGRSLKSSFTVCVSPACKAWGANCSDLTVKEVYKALKAYHDN